MTAKIGSNTVKRVNTAGSTSVLRGVDTPLTVTFESPAAEIKPSPNGKITAITINEITIIITDLTGGAMIIHLFSF